VAVELFGAEDNLRFAVFDWSDPPEDGLLRKRCDAPCSLDLTPGTYRVSVAGSPDSDVRESWARVELEGPTRVTVDPPSATLRTLGLTGGVFGIISLFAGFVIVAQGEPYGAGSSGGRKVAGTVLVLGGAALTTGGFTLYGFNGGPRVTTERLKWQDRGTASNQ
jgi:hypothetical protein